MRIHIEQLRIEAIIGILPEERSAPQKISLDLTGEYEYDGENFIDYANVCRYCEEILVEGQFGLIEDALVKLSENLSRDFPSLRRLDISISKPDIMKNCTVRVSESWRFF